MGKNLSRKLFIIGLSLFAGCAGTSNDSSRIEANFDDVAVSPEEIGADFVRRGRFTTYDNISQVVSGTDQAEVRQLLGSPYRQSGSDWWFYNINLPLEGIDDYLVCQYRVRYDGQAQVSDAEWRRPQCTNRYNALVSVPPPPIQEITLSTDVLFAFDSADLTAVGRSELDTVVGIASNDVELDQITVVGHTDRTGTPEYNLNLSRDRAQSVRTYLISRGLPTESIFAEGRGSNEPIVMCEGSVVTEALKDCLQPNRRVDITIQGIR